MARKFIAQSRGQYAFTWYAQGDLITEVAGYPPGRWMTELPGESSAEEPESVIPPSMPHASTPVSAGVDAALSRAPRHVPTLPVSPDENPPRPSRRRA